MKNGHIFFRSVKENLIMKKSWGDTLEDGNQKKKKETLI